MCNYRGRLETRQLFLFSQLSSRILNFLLPFTTSIFCGHIGKSELAGYALASAVQMFACTCVSLLSSRTLNICSAVLLKWTDFKDGFHATFKLCLVYKVNHI